MNLMSAPYNRYCTTFCVSFYKNGRKVTPENSKRLNTGYNSRQDKRRSQGFEDAGALSLKIRVICHNHRYN